MKPLEITHMSQKSVLNTYFAVGTAGQITSRSEGAIRLKSSKSPETTGEMRAEE